MIKKILTIVIICAMSITMLSSCSAYEGNIPLTDEESDAIAEYMSYLLLKYDVSYDKKLITPTPTPTPRPTRAVTPIPEVTEEAQGEEADKEGTSDYEENEAAPTPTPTPTPADPLSMATTELTKLLGNDKIEISYIGYETFESYTGTEYEYGVNSGKVTDVCVTTNASEDMELLFTAFSLKNKTSKPVKLELLQKDVKWQLDVNVGTICKPIMTMLENDLVFYNAELAAGEEKQAFVAFEINKDTEIEKAYLMSTSDSDTAIIKIK